jgi:hypothetical protein
VGFFTVQAERCPLSVGWAGDHVGRCAQLVGWMLKAWDPPERPTSAMQSVAFVIDRPVVLTARLLWPNGNLLQYEPSTFSAFA